MGVARCQSLVEGDISQEAYHKIFGAACTRGIRVGERVRILASAEECEANTKLATGWSWIAEEAAHCGYVGIVQKLHLSYPHKRCGYYVKFDDGDEQVYVPANVRRFESETETSASSLSPTEPSAPESVNSSVLDEDAELESDIDMLLK